MDAYIWQIFFSQLAAGMIPLNAATFKAASGILIADWQKVNFTGMGVTFPAGTNIPIPANVFNWADPMPNQSVNTYQPGASLSDAYGIFLDSLLPGNVANTQIIQQAKINMAQPSNQMSDGLGLTFPGYTITPGLNDFLLTSLQAVSMNKPPQIDFSVQGPVINAPAPAAPSISANIAARSALPSNQIAPFSAGAMPFFGVNGEAAPISPAATPLARTANIAGRVSSAAATPWTIRFQVQAVQMFTVRPNMWFSQNCVRLFSSKIDPESVLYGKPVLGTDGFLNGRVAQILVAFKRMVTFSGTPGQITNLQNATQNADTFNFGSFHFTNAGNATGIDTDAQGDIIFQDNTNAPMVIGLVIEKF